jgi:hypothetical protein
MVRGRDRNGAIRSVDDYHRLLETIEIAMRALVDADTGESVAAFTSRPASEHEGARAEALPDLLIHWKSNVFPRAVFSQRLGRIEARHGAMRPGNHAAGGICLAAGSDPTLSVRSLTSMKDFGPMIAEAFGIAL